MKKTAVKLNLISTYLFFICFLSNHTFAQASLFTCDFEQENWYQAWGENNVPRNTAIVEQDPALRFEPFKGKALKIKVEKDGHYGTSVEYKFKKHTGSEPEEIYFRYAIRFANDWSPEQGGKLPGIGGTYGKAGWGGRPVHGDDGWSARGLFLGQKNGFTPIGYYAYHIDMKGQYGSNWVWEQNGFQGLKNNHWHIIQQYIKLNSINQANGVARAWVDGDVVFEKTDIRFRSVEALKIEDVWINMYHGGTWTAKTEQHLYIDDVIIHSEYIH